jgi:hypothetical protein
MRHFREVLIGCGNRLRIRLYLQPARLCSSFGTWFAARLPSWFDTRPSGAFENVVENGELLGAHNGPAPASSDSIATRVLSRGDAIYAPAGRADNFSWPRADANAPIPTAVEVVPVAPVSSVPAAPPASAAKDAGSKNAAKMPTDAKKGLTPDTNSSQPRRLDSTSQPPLLRTAPAAANWRPDSQHTQAAGAR